MTGGASPLSTRIETFSDAKGAAARRESSKREGTRWEFGGDCCSFGVVVGTWEEVREGLGGEVESGRPLISRNAIVEVAM